MTNITTKITSSPEETFKLGEELAKKLKPGSFVALIGELGSGKTIFTKGIAKGLGVKDYKYVNSPTFVILKKYEGKMPLYHFDIYRLDSGGDLDSVGYEEYFYGKGVTVVEWADKINYILPKKYIRVELSHSGEHKRKINITQLSLRGGPKGRRSNLKF